jgi:hypothetical protein
MKSVFANGDGPALSARRPHQEPSAPPSACRGHPVTYARTQRRTRPRPQTPPRPPSMAPTGVASPPTASATARHEAARRRYPGTCRCRSPPDQPRAPEPPQIAPASCTHPTPHRETCSASRSEPIRLRSRNPNSYGRRSSESSPPRVPKRPQNSHPQPQTLRGPQTESRQRTRQARPALG